MFLRWGLSCAASSAAWTIATTIRIPGNYRQMELDASAQQGSATASVEPCLISAASNQNSQRMEEKITPYYILSYQFIHF